MSSNKNCLPISNSTVNIVKNEVTDEELSVQNNPADNKVFADERLAWGWRTFKPNCLQWLNSANWFLFFICWFTFLQGMAVNSLVNIALPTLEKRFKLNSKLTGFIISSNEITAVILVVFVSFFGGYGHKTKWLGYGSILTGIAALVFAFPKLLIGKYQPNELKSRQSLCLLNATSTEDSDCTTESATSSISYYLFFIFSQLLAGAGTTPLFTLGPAYLDENVDPKKVSWYLGVFYLTFFLGPGVGSMIGGKLLSIHVDLFKDQDFKLTPKDPRWIGAWWLGPFCCGSILVLLGFILLGFPRTLPGSVAMREKAIKKGYIKKDTKDLSGSLRKILPSTKALLTNWTYLFQTIGFSCSSLVGLGIGPFIFKLLTGKYGASSTEAGIGVAAILLPGSAGGIWLGSFITKKLGVRDSCKQAAKVTFFLQLIGVWGSLAFLIPGCDYDQYAGVDLGYNRSSSGHVTLQNQCNSNCHCSTSTFRPVCGPDGVNYYSPCFAGCRQYNPKKGFTNCSCVDLLFNATASHTQGHAVLAEGVCRENCHRYYFYAFLISCIVVIICGFSNAIPSKVVVLRSVPNNQRAYALGIQFVFLRLLGGLPGPVIIGTMIDETCTLWSIKCGRRENCLNYDFYKLGWIFTVYGFPPHALSLLFFFLSWYMSKYSGDNELEDNITNKKQVQLNGAEHDMEDDTAGQGFSNLGIEIDNADYGTADTKL